MKHCDRGLGSGKEGCVDGFTIMIYSEPKINLMLYAASLPL